MSNDQRSEMDTASVLISLLQQAEPDEVATTLLTEAREISRQEADIQMLAQSDHLTRIARGLRNEKIRARVQELRSQYGRMKKHEEDGERACGRVETVAARAFSTFSKLEEATTVGTWDSLTQIGHRLPMARSSETRKFRLEGLAAVARPLSSWDEKTQDYVMGQLAEDLTAYQDLFDAFVDGEDYVAEYELIVKPGQLYRMVELAGEQNALHQDVESLLRDIKLIQQESSSISELEPHVRHWWGDFRRGLLGNLVEGELSQALAPLVHPVKVLDPSVMMRVAKKALAVGEQRAETSVEASEASQEG